MKIAPISPLREDVKQLIEASDKLLNARYPGESNHLDDISTLSKQNVYFLGYFEDDLLVGIGAVKILSDDGQYGEMKRLFVRPAFR